jgi:hypothetical protein
MMIDDSTGGAGVTVTLERGPEAAENTRAAFLPATSSGLAPAPPPGLLRALDRAAKVAAELDARRLSVRFATGADSRVQAQIIDAEGNVLRQLPVAQALELLSGRGAVAPGELGPELP